ncbi:MAG: C45 family peptidase [Bacteroidales bacterium]|nr:C45 family peptidase [Bacteroidales bacterium]
MLKRRFIRILLYLLAGLLAIILAFYLYYRISTNVTEPEISNAQKSSMERISAGPDEFACEHGWLRKAREGWWEMYLEGSPYEIGYAHGLLTKELMKEQERAFLGRLEELVPTKFYQEFMLGFVRFFNRDLDEYVLPEFQQEIFGISRFASPDFDFMGPAYARMLNYHAAHDIGHAVQNMNLLACTAFGAWDAHSADSSLILGRNFDFYINDEFAKDKILCFIRPDSGYSLAMVTWAGFAGVVSGMNEKGLTVTLNSAKSSIPYSAKTPVSLLAREILQYASNIAEAYAIAQKRQIFVAESFLIGSAADHKAVVIEKSPEKIALFDPDTNFLIVTNHFQSDTFLTDPLNVENMANETSVYRYKRVNELLSSNPPVDPTIAARILRDYKGLNNKDIGLANEKAVNQFIAHHSIIFKPEEKMLWIAGPPYQSGEYWCYDLDSIFYHDTGYIQNPLRNSAKLISNHNTTTIPDDSLLSSKTYQCLLKYRSLSHKIEQGEYREGDTDSLVLYNPEYFQTYRILGNYFNGQGNGQKATEYYREALEKEAPSAADRKLGR